MAITDLIESLTVVTDKKISAICVFIDVKKAFEQYIIKYQLKLEYYGICDIACKWIISYLTNRT